MEGRNEDLLERLNFLLKIFNDHQKKKMSYCGYSQIKGHSKKFINTAVTFKMHEKSFQQGITCSSFHHSKRIRKIGKKNLSSIYLKFNLLPAIF